MATWFVSSSKDNFVNQTAGHHLLSLSLNRAFEQSADTCCSLFLSMFARITFDFLLQLFQYLF